MKNQDQTIQTKFNIPEDYSGQRLDQVLAQLLPEYSRSRLQTWLKSGHILINGTPASAKQKVIGTESVELKITLANEQRWSAQNIPLDIVYQDEGIVIVNKTAGMVTHPAAGNPDNTLVNALLHHVPETQLLPRAGLIHRLDKDTTGLLVVAKTLEAHHTLTKALQMRDIHREYACIVKGALISGGTIDKPMGRHPKTRLKQAIVANGKCAVTHYRILDKFQHYTHLKVILETGRTHQIRVHMAAIDHAIIGDPIYGGAFRAPKNCHETIKNAVKNFGRQALHAKKLSLTNPTSKV